MQSMSAIDGPSLEDRGLVMSHPTGRSFMGLVLTTENKTGMIFGYKMISSNTTNVVKLRPVRTHVKTIICEHFAASSQINILLTNPAGTNL